MFGELFKADPSLYNSVGKYRRSKFGLVFGFLSFPLSTDVFGWLGVAEVGFDVIACWVGCLRETSTRHGDIYQSMGPQLSSGFQYDSFLFLGFQLKIVVAFPCSMKMVNPKKGSLLGRHGGKRSLAATGSRNDMAVVVNTHGIPCWGR